MRDEPRFISGLLVKEPHERAPEYVKARLSIKRVEDHKTTERFDAAMRQERGE